MLLNHALDPVAFRAGDQRILQLLRINARRVFTEQRHRMIRSDDALRHLLILGQAQNPTLPGRSCWACAFRRRIVGEFPYRPERAHSPGRTATRRSSLLVVSSL